MPDNPREKYADLRERLVANSTAWPEGGNDPCWLWVRRASKGYGRIEIYLHHLKKTWTMAPHRVMYMLHQMAIERAAQDIDVDFGDSTMSLPAMDDWPEPEPDRPLPPTFSEEDLVYQALLALRESGLEVDHTCANSLCINPYHLQAVTGQENIDLRDERRAKNNANVAIKKEEGDTYKRLTPHFVGITALFPRRKPRKEIETTETPQVGFDFDAVATNEAPMQARTSAAVISLPVRLKDSTPKTSPDDQGNVRQIDAYRKAPRLKR